MRETAIGPLRPASSVPIPLIPNKSLAEFIARKAQNPPVAAYIGSAISRRKARKRRNFPGRSQRRANANKRLPLCREAFYKAAMICPTTWRVFLLIGGVALTASPAPAQLALPGAATAAPAGTPAAPAKPKKARSAAKAETGGKAGSPVSKSAPGAASIDGRPLMLNGGAGLIQISGEGQTLQVDKLSLAGEGVTDASQRCVVNIVGAKPIAATGEGRPDGLQRYLVDVPACPFAFDVLDGAVLVPAQITACVFKAADCQTSPSGLWGPDGTSLEADATAIGKRRTEAEKAMSRALHALVPHAKESPDVDALLKDQAQFPVERGDICRDYVKEAAHGFCAASVTAGRAALLEARLAALTSPAKTDKTDKSAKPEKTAKKPKKKAKPAEAGAAGNPQ